jgi:hypothetical protein
MLNKAHARTKQKVELRINAVESNIEELAHLKEPVARAQTLLGVLTGLEADQASLTADRQDVTKRLGEVVSELQKLLVFLDAGVRHRYGNRSEKLVEFGQQPFRSKPRVRVVGTDGKAVKRNAKETEPPVAPE